MTYEAGSYTVQDPSAIHSIALTDMDVPVEVLPSGDDGMYATYFESDREKYGIELDGHTLIIRKKPRAVIGMIHWHRPPEYVKLTMYLPVDYSGELHLVTADGDIRVQGVTMSHLSTKTADGDITLDRAHFFASAACKTADGDIMVHRITAPEITVKTADGNIILDRPLVSEKLSCRTVDGRISGTLAGRPTDYRFAVRKLDGHSNIASGGEGATLLEARITDGSIKLFFEDGAG